MNFLRGWIGEQETTFWLWISLNSKTYQRIHNIIIPSRSGTTQIDHLLVSPYGIFIVETKKRTGWIFGSKDQAKWTQTVYKRKYRFQNPLKQTFRQKKVLSQFLNIDESLINTIVYFVGNCRLKTELPDNVMRSGLRRYIRRFRSQVLSNDDVDQIINKLIRHKAESGLRKRDHLRSLKQRHASKTMCPWCGSKLVVKTARKGQSSGSQFLGCVSYPRCRFTKDI
jgi:restriction system protein